MTMFCYRFQQSGASVSLIGGGIIPRYIGLSNEAIEAFIAFHSPYMRGNRTESEYQASFRKWKGKYKPSKEEVKWVEDMPLGHYERKENA